MKKKKKLVGTEPQVVKETKSKYKVLKRIDSGYGITANGKYGYTVYFPKDDPVPKDVKADRIGVPRSLDLQAGPHTVQMQIDRSGWIMLTAEKAQELLFAGAVEPRTKADVKYLRPAGPGKKVGETEPLWVKTARGGAAGMVM